MQVDAGTLWAGNDRKKFIVISTAVVDGHKWIYYRDEVSPYESREYSCYEESFLQRFAPITNESTRKA